MWKPLTRNYYDSRDTALFFIPPFHEPEIEYQLSKVKEGNGKVLCTSTGDELAAMPAYMKLISQLNDRVKLPYAEFILSLYPGENLSDERWLSLTEEYIERMGYGKSCYAVVLNTDKAHSHVHVLLTTIDEEGKSIPSGNNYSRSEKISRELEQKYGLLLLEREGGKKTTLGESQYRSYYFDTALKKPCVVIITRISYRLFWSGPIHTGLWISPCRK